jgi:hypothetical protein
MVLVFGFFGLAVSAICITVLSCGLDAGVGWLAKRVKCLRFLSKEGKVRTQPFADLAAFHSHLIHTQFTFSAQRIELQCTLPCLLLYLPRSPSPSNSILVSPLTTLSPARTAG